MTLQKLYKEYKALEKEYDELKSKNNIVAKGLRENPSLITKPLPYWPGRYIGHINKFYKIANRMYQIRQELLEAIPLDAMIQVADYYVAHLSDNVLKEIRLHESS